MRSKICVAIQLTRLLKHQTYRSDCKWQRWMLLLNVSA